MKMKNVIIFSRDQHSIRVCERKKILKDFPRIVNVGKKSYIVNWDEPLYVSSLRRFYLVDVESGKQVLLDSAAKNPISPDELDNIVGSNIIREITRGIAKSTRDSIIFGILGALIGFLSGLFVMQLILQGKIDELYKTCNAFKPTELFIKGVLSCR